MDIINTWVRKLREKSRKVIFLKVSTVCPPYPAYGFPILGFNHNQVKNIKEKNIPESFKKQNLNLPCNYLYSIYIVLGIISNLEIIWNTQENVCRYTS